MRNQIYRPYIDVLLSIEKTVAPVLRISAAKPHRRSAVIDIRQYLISKLRNFGIRMFHLADIVTGRAFLVFRGTVY
jgi:hypothetical protein